MSPSRKRRLFPRALGEVVRAATDPILEKRSSLVTTLLRDWHLIVGTERAAIARPMKVLFSRGDENTSATLHLEVDAAHAAEFPYYEAQILEQIARYSGYKAITRLVVHADYTPRAKAAAPPTPRADATPDTAALDIKSILERMKKQLALKDSAGT